MVVSSGLSTFINTNATTFMHVSSTWTTTYPSLVKLLGRGSNSLLVRTTCMVSCDDSFKFSSIYGLQQSSTSLSLRYTEEKSSILVIVLRVHTCPIELREKLAIALSEYHQAIKELCSLNHIEEAVVLCACDRMEIYVVALSQHRGIKEVIEWMSRTSGVPVSEICEHLFVLSNNDAIQQIFAVLPDLDSLLLGEGRILAQIKQVDKVGQGGVGLESNIKTLSKPLVTSEKCVRTDMNERGVANESASASTAVVELTSMGHQDSSKTSSLLLKDDLQTFLPICFEGDDVRRMKECVSLLKKCNDMKQLKEVHGHMLRLGLFCDNFCVGNLLSDCVLSNWGDMDYASLVFSQINNPGTFEFNTMIRGHVKYNNFQGALNLYVEMLERENLPDNFTYPFVLKACAGLSLTKLGRQIHGQVFKLAFHDDLFVLNSMINMYGKCENIRDSCAVFKGMEEKSIASWSALVASHANMGMWWECLEIFGNMTRKGSWRAEETILVSVISACTHLGALDLGMSIHGYLKRNLSGLNVIVETSLLDMYIKCGSMEKALSLFYRMSKKNRLSYSVMISGLGMHGNGHEALLLFSKMLEQGIEPDDVVYLGVLSACRHAGLVQEGLELFNKMSLEHHIQPTIQHYGCILDLLGRVAMFDEVFSLIEKMPIEPNDVVWRSILSAARVHSNLEVGQKAARKLMQLGSDNAGNYIMMSSMFARAKNWKDAASARSMVADKGLDQAAGFSSVEVKRRVYTFLSQDKSHCNWEEIYEMIHQMEWQLKFEGYKPDTSEVIHNVDEEEKQQRLRHHSQKLALAFALLHTPVDMTIRIVRNVKMCRDTHTYTKFISVIYNRTIVVRDRNRFHHFKDGTCSCKDYW